MPLKLKNRLILSYILLAFIIIGMISLLININVKKGFEKYIINVHQQLVSDIRMRIIAAYTEETGYDLIAIESIGIDAIEKGLIITLYDSQNEIKWSAMEHNSGLCEAMITNIKESMFSHYANWEGNYTEDIYDIIKKDERIGQLKIGYLGPFYFNEEELYFISSINQILIAVAAISMMLAVVSGILIAKSVTKPIESVISYLNHINKEDGQIQRSNPFRIQELRSLSQSELTLEERIAEQEGLRRQLTQDMAHELKTPLTAIQGQLEAMIDGIFPVTVERLKSCHDEIIRIKSLIQEIDTLSVLENKQTVLLLARFDFIEMLKDLSDAFEAELNRHKMQLRITYGSHFDKDEYTHFYGDADKLRQVFINLTSNAIKYAGEGTLIQMTLDNAPKQCIIHFEDNGKGIEDKHIPYIFELF